MQYDFNLTAGGSQVIEVKGRFFKYKSGMGAIRIKATAGGYIDLLPGQGVWNVDFSSLIVQDKSGAANCGVIMAGNFDFHDDRISGTVDVVDGGKWRSVSGQACISYYSVDPQAAMSANIQIWNPAGSGKNVYIEQVSAFSVNSAANGIMGTRSVAPLTGFLGNGVRKNFGMSQVSSSEIRCQYVASIGSLGDANRIFALDNKVVKLFRLTEPILITPGTGLLVFNSMLGEHLGCNFEFFEESV